MDVKYKIAEYDAFGPWVTKITEEYPLPPLFIPFYKEDSNHLMRVKIPRNIDRANANPDMDLYDYVIGLYENHIYILERVEKNVKETTIFNNEIEGLKNSVDLLTGEFSIFLKDRKITIPYNTVSWDVITDMMRIIRGRYTAKTYQKIQSPYSGKQISIKETLFRNLINEMRINGESLDINVIQPSVILQRNSKKLGQKTLQLIKSERLLSTLHLSNEREILAITRGLPFKKRRDVIYSYSHTFIPIEKLQSVTLEKDDYYTNLHRLYMKTNGHTFMFYFDDSNNESKDYFRNLSDMLTSL